MTEKEKIAMDLTGQKFVRGIEIANGRLMVMTQDPGLDLETQPHTGFIYWSKVDGWIGIGLGSKLTVDATINEDGSAMVMIDPTGFIHEMDGTNVTKSFIKMPDGTLPPEPLRAVRNIGGRIHAVGVGRTAFVREARDQWTLTSSDATSSPTYPAAFQAMDGFSANEHYTAGWDGEIWHFDGHKWYQKESPTNVVLNDICAGPDTSVAVGLAGQIVMGRGDDWDMIAHDETNEPFWSVRYFQDAFYLTALSGIYRLKNGELSAFRELDAGMRTAYALSVGPSGLWSIGGEDITLFDGTDWHTIGQS